MNSKEIKRIKAIADLLFESACEIDRLRRENELLSGKVEVIDIFGRVTSSYIREIADCLLKDFVI